MILSALGCTINSRAYPELVWTEKRRIFVIPAQAGIQTEGLFYWIPACAGMTETSPDQFAIRSNHGTSLLTGVRIYALL